MDETDNILYKLKAIYGDIGFTTLGQLAETIKQASSVRSGKNANDIGEYYEVGVSDIDKTTSYIEVTGKTKKYNRYNNNYLNSQKLQKGDIIVGYRGKKTHNIGLVERESELPLVPNNGLIRIRFKEDQRSISPNVIWQLLLSPVYQEYLQSTLNKSTGTNLLTVDTLKELPIPMFFDGSHIDKAIEYSVDIKKNMEEINDIWESLKSNFPESLVSVIVALSRKNHKKMNNEILKSYEKINDMKKSIKNLEIKIKEFEDITENSNS